MPLLTFSYLTIFAMKGSIPYFFDSPRYTLSIFYALSPYKRRCYSYYKAQILPLLRIIFANRE